MVPTPWQPRCVFSASCCECGDVNPNLKSGIYCSKFFKSVSIGVGSSSRCPPIPKSGNASGYASVRCVAFCTRAISDTDTETPDDATASLADGHRASRLTLTRLVPRQRVLVHRSPMHSHANGGLKLQKRVTLIVMDTGASVLLMKPELTV